MQIDFFNKEELGKLNKKLKVKRICLTIAFLLFALSLTLLIVFATYQNRIYIITFGALLLTSIVWIIIYLLFKIIQEKRNCYLYEQILTGKVLKLDGVITYVGDYSISILNAPKVYEIRIQVNNSVFNLYLFDCFDKTHFAINKNVSVDVVSEYIRGVTIYEK